MSSCYQNYRLGIPTIECNSEAENILKARKHSNSKWSGTFHFTLKRKFQPHLNSQFSKHLIIIKVRLSSSPHSPFVRYFYLEKIRRFSKPFLCLVGFEAPNSINFATSNLVWKLNGGEEIAFCKYLGNGASYIRNSSM